MSAASFNPSIAAILADGRRKQRDAILTAAGVAGVIVCAFAYAGAFDPKRYADALPTILQARRRRHAARFQPLAGMGPPACWKRCP